jgi:general secretion pathway protein G
MTLHRSSPHRVAASARTRAHRHGEAGLTVLEVMIVLVILSMLGVVAGMQVTQQFDRAKVDLARLQLRQLQNAIALFEVDMRRYPTAEEGIGVLIDTPQGDTAGWRGPYVRNRDLLLDPWGEPVAYLVEGDHVTVASLGSDRKSGGEGTASDIGVSDAD